MEDKDDAQVEIKYAHDLITENERRKVCLTNIEQKGKET